MRSIFGVILALFMFAGLAECLRGGRPTSDREFPFLVRIEKGNNYAWCLGLIVSRIRVLFPSECLRRAPLIGSPTANAVPLVNGEPPKKYKGWFELDSDELHTELEVIELHLAPPGLPLDDTNLENPNSPRSISFSSRKPVPSDAIVVGLNRRAGAMTILDDVECYDRLGKLYFPMNDRLQNTKLLLGEKMMCAVRKMPTGSVGDAPVGDVPPGAACERDLGAPVIQNGTIVGMVVRSFCPRYYPPVTIITRLDDSWNDAKGEVRENRGMSRKSSLPVPRMHQTSNKVKRQPLKNDANIENESIVARSELPCTTSSCEAPVTELTEQNDVSSKSIGSQMVDIVAAPRVAILHPREDSSVVQAHALEDVSRESTPYSTGNGTEAQKQKRQLGGVFMSRNDLQNEEDFKMIVQLKNRISRRARQAVTPGAAGFSTATSVVLPAAVSGNDNVSDIGAHSPINMSIRVPSPAEVNLKKELSRKSLFEAAVGLKRTPLEVDSTEEEGLVKLSNDTLPTIRLHVRDSQLKQGLTLSEQEVGSMEMLIRNGKSQRRQRRWAGPDDASPAEATPTAEASPPAEGASPDDASPTAETAFPVGAANETDIGANNTIIRMNDTDIANTTEIVNATHENITAVNGTDDLPDPAIAGNFSANVSSSDEKPGSEKLIDGNTTTEGNNITMAGSDDNTTIPPKGGDGISNYTEDDGGSSFNISGSGAFNDTGDVVLSGGDFGLGLERYEGCGNDSSGSGSADILSGFGESGADEIHGGELDLGPEKRKKPPADPHLSPPSTPPHGKLPTEGKKKTTRMEEDPQPVGPPEPNDDRPDFQPQPGKPAMRHAAFSPKNLPLNSPTLAMIYFIISLI